MSRSFRKNPYKIAGKRRSQMTRVHHRLARARFKRDPALPSHAFNKIESDINYELHAGYPGPTWEEFEEQEKEKDPTVSTKVLKRKYYRLYRNK